MSSGILTIIAFGLVAFIGIVLVFLILAINLSGGVEMQERLHTYALVPDISPRRRGGSRETSLARLRLRLNAMLASLGSQELNIDLMSANWPITATEYILIRITGTLLGFFLGWLVAGSPISGVGLAIIIYFIPSLFLNRSINRRRTQFERQLVDVLVLINGAVRAGFSLLQALEVVEREVKSPASEEFHRVRREVGLGLSIGQALDNLANRMQNSDLNLVVTAIKIHYQVGGNLSTMLMAVTETVRDRIRLFSEIRVITTQQRYTSYLLSLLPFFVGGIIFLLNPEYMSRLFEPGAILCIPIGALVGILLGHLIIRRMIKLDV
jgi:tight adherence protein B